MSDDPHPINGPAPEPGPTDTNWEMIASLTNAL
jgi:hypothetical protein